MGGWGGRRPNKLEKLGKLVGYLSAEMERPIQRESTIRQMVVSLTAVMLTKNMAGTSTHTFTYPQVICSND